MGISTVGQAWDCTQEVSTTVLGSRVLSLWEVTFLLNLFFNTILASMPEWSISGKPRVGEIPWHILFCFPDQKMLYNFHLHHGLEFDYNQDWGARLIDSNAFRNYLQFTDMKVHLHCEVQMKETRPKTWLSQRSGFSQTHNIGSIGIKVFPMWRQKLATKCYL